MPFDGKPEAYPAKVGTLESLIAWLETKDPNTTYTYTDARTCVLARYARDHGYRFTAHLFHGFDDSFTYYTLFGRALRLSHFRNLPAGLHTYDEVLQAALRRLDRRTA